MAGHAVGLIIVLVLVYNVQCQDPPKIEGSYIAWGEIVQPFQSYSIQIAVEESYNADTQNAAFIVYQSGRNLTFVKNYATNQTFRYAETYGEEIVNSEKTYELKLRCIETDEKQWMEIEIARLLNFGDDKGTIKFPLAQLFNIPSKFMVDKLKGISTTYRGIPAKSWVYEIKTKTEDRKNDVTLTIKSYWSDGSWNTSAGARMAPLGFNVSKVVRSQNSITVEDYTINVFGFIPNTYNKKIFKAVQGVVCPNRTSTVKFPNVQSVKAISFHSELTLPDYQQMRYIDTWFDTQNQLLRVDMERFDEDDPTQRQSYQSEIAIGQIGVVFRLDWSKDESYCDVIPFDKYKNDMQNLFNIKQNLKRWNLGKLFGLNDTSYVYIGQTTKNHIPCHLFQGVRNDWPDKASNIKSLWEWCFNIDMTNKNDAFLFQDDEIGLISANVIILSDPNGIYKNFRMNYHFYGVKVQDSKLLDATEFDIGRCFQDHEKRALQFYLDVKIGSDNKMMFANATSDVTFLQKWKDELYENTGLNRNSLRISSVRGTIDGDKMYIKFSILNAHKDLPNYKKQLSAFDAERTLRMNVNAGKVSILYQFERGRKIILAALEHSVNLQIDSQLEINTMPPLIKNPASATESAFHLKMDMGKDKSQSSSVKPPSITDSANPTSTTEFVTNASPQTKGKSQSPSVKPPVTNTGVTDSENPTSATKFVTTASTETAKDKRQSPSVTPPVSDTGVTDSKTPTSTTDKTETQKDKIQSSSAKPPVTVPSETPPVSNTTNVTDSFSKSSRPDDGITTPLTPKKKVKYVVKYIGHQHGAIAGVGISMLFVGVLIGAGIIYKVTRLSKHRRR